MCAMLIGKDELCGLIPHAGSMCLLESVLGWDAREIRCSATSLLARESGTRIRPGYLAALRDVMLQQDFIDHITAPLLVHARMIAALTGSFMYRFTISAGNEMLANARATVIDPQARTR